MSPRLLDLFCGAGGAGAGYASCGFEVVGVDAERLAIKRYPFEGHVGDWLEKAEQLVGSVQAIHASPPCQHYSVTKHSHTKEHPDLLGPVRDFLRSTGLPYVIENVVGAPLIDPLMLCGTMFGLEADDPATGERLWLKRHRLFESNVLLMAPPTPCRCLAFKRLGRQCGGVYGGGSCDRTHAKTVRRGGYTPAQAVRQTLMGIDWMTQDQLSQAIPPAYTEHIGQRLLDSSVAVAA